MGEEEGKQGGKGRGEEITKEKRERRKGQGKIEGKENTGTAMMMEGQEDGTAMMMERQKDGTVNSLVEGRCRVTSPGSWWQGDQELMAGER